MGLVGTWDDRRTVAVLALVCALGNKSGDASCIHYTLERSQRVCTVIYSWRPTSLQRGGGELLLDRLCSRSVLLLCRFKSEILLLLLAWQFGPELDLC